MKKFTLISFLICFFTSGVIAQNWPAVESYQNVYTPNGSVIQGIVFYPLSGTDYSDALSYINANYPNVTILENPTSEYNCYSYAFHLSEVGSPKVWINPNTTTGTPNLSKYWTDGSFVQVCNETDAQKTYYYQGDHAALTQSSQSGKYESKWGPNCRVIHDPTDVPYTNPQNRKYYTSTEITGDEIVCSTSSETYTVVNISGATYSWSKSSNLYSPQELILIV